MKIIDKFKRTRQVFSVEIDRSISANLTGFQRLLVYLDFKKEQALFGIAFSNYFQYEFFWKNQKGRRKFSCDRETKRIYNICNPEKYRYLTGDKAAFNKKFDAYLGRKWLNAAACTQDEFCKFADGQDCFFVKPDDGECGIGAQIVYNDGNLNYTELYKTYQRENVILEEVIKQHPEMAEFNESSVNTIRVVTLRDAHEKIHVMAGVLRIGRKGEVADNFHHHGICASIDMETGIVYSVGIDHDHKRYVVHPDSGKPIVGFVVPYWKEIKETVIKAATELTELRYIGWDIAIKDDGKLVIIEGNSTPDTNVTQVADQIGKWDDYKLLIEQLEGLQ